MKKVGLKLNIQKTKIMASGQIHGETMETVTYFIFPDSKIFADGIAAMKLKDTCSLEEKLWQHIKQHRHYFANKGLSSQGYGFFSNHV